MDNLLSASFQSASHPPRNVAVPQSFRDYFSPTIRTTAQRRLLDLMLKS